MPRPDPEKLIERLKEQEARKERGKFKIFLGASAGVGKTYAMLLAARQQRQQGRDVVVGVVETHGRKETEALLEGLECLLLKDVDYRGRKLKEFDIDAALARHPALILVDELAHSNVAGSRHAKRYQDVEDLLSAGVDVYSTINVQHLETLNDVVGGITGIRVWETVPDRIFDAADEVVLVDLPPDELLQRLKEGKIYLPHQAERAVRHFFRKGNLIALRELALRRTADRVDHQMIQYRRDQAVSPVWQTRDSLLACIGPEKEDERVVRAAARLASRLDVPWHVVYVETPALQRLPDSCRQDILLTLKRAQEAGAETATLSGQQVEKALVSYARDHNLSKILVGRLPHLTMRWPWQWPMVERLSREAPDLDIIQVARGASGTREVERVLEGWRERWRAPWQSYAMGILFCAVATAFAFPFQSVLELTNIAMLFLMAVVITAVRYGLGPAIAASFINVASFDFFFVPPRFSFAVSDAQYLVTFAVMLGVGLMAARLTAGLTIQAKVASSRERRVRALYEMSRELSGALMLEQIEGIGQRFVESNFGAHAMLIHLDGKDQLVLPEACPEGMAPIDPGICQWVFDHGAEAGFATDTLSGSPLLYLPLIGPMRTRGVLALEPVDPSRIMEPEQRRMLDTMARLLAIALERVHYVDVAQHTTLQMESERLRNSLLAAISHDLRTPLSALVALVDSLSLLEPRLPENQRDIANQMREKALRMNEQVNNLLDMARLQAGSITLNSQWQPLEEVVGSALQSLAPALGKRRLVVTIDQNLPLLEFDTVLLERVFVNLLDNAAKYTQADAQIEIGVQVQGGSDALIWVEDDGPGLPPGKEEAVFKKFERGQRESTTPGVGLGLAICQAIVEAHRGTIRAFNRSSGGTRFEFTLPLGSPPALPGLEGGRDVGAESLP